MKKEKTIYLVFRFENHYYAEMSVLRWMV